VLIFRFPRRFKRRLSRTPFRPFRQATAPRYGNSNSRCGTPFPRVGENGHRSRSRRRAAYARRRRNGEHQSSGSARRGCPPFSVPGQGRYASSLKMKQLLRSGIRVGPRAEFKQTRDQFHPPLFDANYGRSFRRVSVPASGISASNPNSGCPSTRAEFCR